jgi:hypothetical protein
MRRWQSALLWVPLLTLAALRVALLVSSAVGRPAFWTTNPMTLSEAAAYRDGGEVARQLEAGADPNAAYHAPAVRVYRSARSRPPGGRAQRDVHCCRRAQQREPVYATMNGIAWRWRN